MSKPKKYSKKRRHLLQGIAAGTAGTVVAPQHWQKPVINAVMLPAHAQASAALLNCVVAFSEGDNDNPVVVLSEGVTNVDDDGSDTSSRDSWDGSLYTPTVTVSPASLAGDVTLVIATTNAQIDDSQSLTPDPLTADTDTGVVIFPPGDTLGGDDDVGDAGTRGNIALDVSPYDSDNIPFFDGADDGLDEGDDDEGVSSIAFTFSALGAANDCVITLNVTAPHANTL
jgi:hypothetical protein